MVVELVLGFRNHIVDLRFLGIYGRESLVGNGYFWDLRSNYLRRHEILDLFMIVVYDNLTLRLEFSDS